MGEVRLSPPDIAIIKSMCRNDLSAAAVARDLNYHPNSIYYHIGQIEKKTGYDCRTFFGALMLLFMISGVTNGKIKI